MLSKLFMPQDNNVGPSLEQRAQTLGQASLKLPSPYTQSTQSVQASTATPPTPKPQPGMQQAPQMPSINLNIPQQTPMPTKKEMPAPQVAPSQEPIGAGINTDVKGTRAGEPEQQEIPLKQGPQRMANPSLSIPQANFGPSHASQSVAGLSTVGGDFSLNSRPKTSGECGPGFQKGYDGRCYPVFGG